MLRKNMRAWSLVAAVAIFGTQVSTSAQGQQNARQQPVVESSSPVRRITVDDAVRLAIQNNLGVQVARLNPQIEDLNVALARSNWAPSFNSTFQKSSTDTPNTGFLTGATGGADKITSGNLASNVGISQTVPWGGGNYQVGWDSSRATSTSAFQSFNPQLRSSFSFQYVQPLLRGLGIDGIRQQLLVSYKNRDIADIQLRQSIATTTRTVRNAYWDLAYAIAFFQVQQQSLDLANESLRNTRARVEIGTTPPIDIVEAEAEVATREEAVIVAQTQIETSQDTLRTLVYDPQTPDFWNIQFEPAELPSFQPTVIDVNTAVLNALDRRTDLQQSKRSLEATDINIKYQKDQTLPEINAQVNYGLSGIGGLPVNSFSLPGQSLPILPPRGFGSVLGDLFSNSFPAWTAALTIRYPLGTSPAEAGLARSRLQYSQTQTQIRNQQLQVVTQVRQAARQAQTNRKRVDTTGASRQLAERRLEAEQRKFAAGTSTNFLVFQAQRDLAQARNNELRAILDYQQSLVDFDTVQEVPLNGGGAVSSPSTGTGTTGVLATGGGGAAATAAGTANTTGATAGR
jgi:outer membrane protein TolC